MSAVTAGYQLSRRAAAAEARYDLAHKSVVQSFTPATWPGRQDGDNFVTNRVTLQEYEDRSPGNVLGLSAAWACVNLLAGTIGSLPLMVYRDVAGQRQIAREHPLYALLHDRPNYDQTALDFLEFLCASIELHGNGYAEKQFGTGGQIVGLMPVRPDLVQVSRQRDGSLRYRWTDEAGPHDVAQDEMLHVRGFGGGPLGGASTLSVCRATFGAAMDTDRAAAGMFRNGMRPSGVLTTDKQLTPEQMAQAQHLIDEKHVGAIRSGRPLLLNNGLTWTQLTMNADDAQMLESRRFSVEEICRIFGVPPHMIGHTENSTSWGTGLEQQTLGFQKFTLRRRLKRIEMALEQQLLTAADRAAGVTVEFNLEGLLRGDSKGRAEVNEIYLRNKVVTINEVRAQDNKPPVPWGDRPWVQMQDVQMGADGGIPGAGPAQD